MADTAVQHQDSHEQRDVSRSGLLIFGAAFALFVIIAVTLLWFVFGTHQGNFSAAQRLGEVPNDIELGQRDELASYMKAQDDELDRLAWTDDSRRFAKVPIDDAMQLLASRGAAR